MDALDTENAVLAVKMAIGVGLLLITLRQRRRMGRPKKPRKVPRLASVGQVFLAYLPDTLTAPVLNAQNPPGELGAPTGERIEQIEQAKAAVRRDGLAFTSGGLIPGLTSVAAPVFTIAGSLPMAVAIALPSQQAAPEVMRELSAELLATTRAMSAEVGCTPGRLRGGHAPALRNVIRWQAISGV